MGGHVCPWWFVYTFDNRFRRIFHAPENMLQPYVYNGMTVLDAGCGAGFFSIAMAKLVGDEGRVIAADVQQEMLNITARRAEKEGVLNRIRLHKCDPDDLGVEGQVDFALAFWMVHEVPDTQGFFRQVRSGLKPKGKVLVAEPKFHVSSKRFQQILDSARISGLTLAETPSIRLSWSALLT